ncbi:LytR/AlgR family response regulator transcription factor [Hymenobacter terrenus]|uniref:LytR/AlgR family response regulator transcription factor n=1 Tax=Hymenobacter terrenus TaxID=1629124 RepID=UPI0006199E60|nr:LytTR family DNA-binding domain-containing protein [Hymenobacter terrenus]
MNILILEDEQPAAEKLCAFVRQYDADATVVAVLAHVQEAREWLRTHPQPDLVLSDIELLGGNVFPLYQERLIACPVIFTTAYDTFFVQAFEQNGIAYLLKPFQYAQFCGAMQKYEQLRRTFQQDLIHRLAAGLQPARRAYKQRFVIKTKGGIVLLETKDIAYVQIKNGLTHAYDWQNRSYLLAESLNQLEELLDPAEFFRLNRGEIVHINAIERLETHFNDALAVKLKNRDLTLIASASRTPELRRWLNGL